MASKNKTKNWLPKFLIIVGIIVVAQIMYLFIFGKSTSLDVRQAIEEQVSSQSSLDGTQKELLRLQLAVNDFMMKHDGAPPKSLEELVPSYFDVIPKDPTSGDSFIYKAEATRFSLMTTQEQTMLAAASKEGDEISKDEEMSLIASLDQNTEKARYVYDSTGKRDPFRSFNLAPQNSKDAAKTPLEKYDIGQLKLTAVLEGFDEPKIVIENAAGRGFTVGKGAKIGTNGGEIADIQKDRILILETSTDFTGQTSTRTIEMRLRSKDLDESLENN